MGSSLYYSTCCCENTNQDSRMIDFNDKDSYIAFANHLKNIQSKNGGKIPIQLYSTIKKLQQEECFTSSYVRDSVGQQIMNESSLGRSTYDTSNFRDNEPSYVVDSVSLKSKIPNIYEKRLIANSIAESDGEEMLKKIKEKRKQNELATKMCYDKLRQKKEAIKSNLNKGMLNKINNFREGKRVLRRPTITSSIKKNKEMEDFRNSALSQNNYRSNPEEYDINNENESQIIDTYEEEMSEIDINHNN